MISPDKTLWTTSRRDELSTTISSILVNAGIVDHSCLIFSIFETIGDPVKEDLSDWVVRHPNLTSEFARGNAQFLLGHDEKGDPVYSEVYVNPSWAAVVIEGDRSCRARGAPELDHVFLEGVEAMGTIDGIQRFELVWGS